jgi:hypothetical protein
MANYKRILKVGRTWLLELKSTRCPKYPTFSEEMHQIYECRVSSLNDHYEPAPENVMSPNDKICLVWGAEVLFGRYNA